MAIISRETFEKFLKEEKENVKKEYLKWQEEAETNPYFEGKISNMEDLFDKEVLQSDHKIKTWADVVIYKTELWDFINKLSKEIANCPYIESKLYKKLIATIQIQHLLELGYGGIVTDNEYILNEHSTDEDFWGIWINAYGKVECTPIENCRDLLVFRDQQQAKEFMSYMENVDLILQYYLI